MTHPDGDESGQNNNVSKHENAEDSGNVSKHDTDVEDGIQSVSGELGENGKDRGIQKESGEFVENGKDGADPDKTEGAEVVDDSAKKKVEEPIVPFLRLFAYADKYDYLLMFFGTIGAAAHGAALPVFLLFFGKILNSLGDSFNSNIPANNVSKVCESSFTSDVITIITRAPYCQLK